MNRTITSLTLLAAAALPATAAITGQWRYHPTFDNSVIKVIDTPSRAYFIGYPQTLNPALPAKANPDCTLFYFDKEGEEVVSAVQRHDLSSAIVRDIEYNPDKGYLLIIYGDQNIDLLHDDGSVSNVGALMNASIASSKSINATSFDPANDLIWLATDMSSPTTMWQKRRLPICACNSPTTLRPPNSRHPLNSTGSEIRNCSSRSLSTK